MTQSILDTYLTIWLVRVLLFGAIGAIILYFTLTLHRINKWLLNEAEKRAGGGKS